MTDSNVTPEAVWKAMNKDLEFQQLPNNYKAAVRQYVEALPLVLTDMLDLPVTFRNLMQAKAAVIRYFLDTDFIEVSIAALPDEAFVLYDRDEMGPVLKEILETGAVTTLNLVNTAEKIMEAQGLTDEDVMLSPDVGLKEKAVELYRAGKLTIGTLLTTQPMVIYRNTN